MAFEVENLSWVQQLPQLSDNEQKVLLALSDERYRWRTIRGIIATTGIDRPTVEAILAKSIESGMVQPAFSREREIVYGLVERTEN